MGNTKNVEMILEGIFVGRPRPGRPRVLSNDRRHLLDSHSPQMKGGAECRLAFLDGNVSRREEKSKRMRKGVKQSRHNR